MGKFTSYPADASPSSDDLVLTVNDPLGVPANKKVTLSSVWVPAESASTRASSVAVQVANESSSRVTADNTLTSAVVAESSSRVAADNTLTSAVVAESSSRVASDNALDTKAESASTRASSVQDNVNVLTSAVVAESASRVAADNVLTSAVVAESSSRVAADNALDTKAESGSTRASVADSKAISVELQFSYVPTTTLSSASTLSTDQIQGGFIMVSAAVTITLPAVVIGALITIYSTAANAVVVDPANADRIILDGVDKTDGVAITSASGAGDYVTLLGDSADGWTVIGRSGTWT